MLCWGSGVLTVLGNLRAHGERAAVQPFLLDLRGGPLPTLVSARHSALYSFSGKGLMGTRGCLVRGEGEKCANYGVGPRGA